MYEYRIYVNSGSLWIRELCLVESGINVRAMEKAGFVDLVGRENFCRNIEEALDHADKMLEK